MGYMNESGSPLLYRLLLFLFLLKFCHSADTIATTESITDGETLVSEEGNFTLGFFSPGTSRKRYVGIWFAKVSIPTFVWVANREKPITDSSGVLKIADDGNLIVMNGTNSIIWSTNITSGAVNSTATLLDSGNLVLRVDSGSVLWESFANPCDTALPGMKISSNQTTGVNISLTSWTDSNDPSTGSFDLRVDPRDYLQIFVWKNLTRYWRSGQWDGQIFTGVPEMTNVYQNGIYLEGNSYEYLSNRDSFSRFVLNSTGAVQEYIWDEEIKDWTLRWSQIANICQIYNHCGSNGYCRQNSSPVCDCLPGFDPNSNQDWVSGNWSDGCYRRTQFQCEMNTSSLSKGEGNGFWKLTGMKLPDSSRLITGVQNLEICESVCTSNCSCVAFAFVNGIGCMFWSADLMDIQGFSEGGEDLYIRLADSELDKLNSKSNKKRLAVIISVSCAVGIVLLGTAFFLWKLKSKQKDYWRRGVVSEQSIINSDNATEAAKYFSEDNNPGDGINHGKCPDLPLFDLGTLESATDNFCSEKKLGEGGFGPVYKGSLPGGPEIAIKRLSKSSGQGLEEFKNEVKVISKLQHRNLVRLLGCCVEGDEKMLIYEYMPNKSLDAFIFDPKKRELLDWTKRFHIIEGIARGLLYLHRDSRLRIIHRDLKASNILLDGEMNPKISDFGMARIFGGNQTQENTIRVVGTYGYMSPEYAMEGLFSEKSDVFSFGVLLLEIVSGRKNNAFSDSENSSNLLGFARRLWNEDKGMDLMDPLLLLRDSRSKHEVLRCIHVGLLCTQDAAIDRPTMPSVVAMLGTENANLPTPKQLQFSAKNNPVDETSSRNSYAAFSTSDITITVVEGR